MADEAQRLNQEDIERHRMKQEKLKKKLQDMNVERDDHIADKKEQWK